MEIKNRKSVFEKMKKFSPCKSDEDFIEVTEWTNGEGWDIIISSGNSEKNMSIHFDELEAINYLIKFLEYEKK